MRGLLSRGVREMTIQNVADRQRVRNADSGWGQIGSGRDADQPWWTTSATPPVAHVIRRVSRQRILCDHRAKRIAGRMPPRSLKSHTFLFSSHQTWNAEVSAGERCHHGFGGAQFSLCAGSGRYADTGPDGLPPGQPVGIRQHQQQLRHRQFRERSQTLRRGPSWSTSTARCRRRFKVSGAALIPI